MKRFVPTFIVLVLLAGTVAAFAFTERVKLDKSPISAVKIDPVFSPLCKCRTDVATIGFRIAKTDEMTLSIVDSANRAVRTLVDDRRTFGIREYTWDGRDNEGRLVPDGTYKIRVQLGDLDRTFFPPNPIVVDTTPPKVTIATVKPSVFSPDGDRRNDGITVTYSTNEPARVFLFVNGRRRVISKLRGHGGELHWYGKLDGTPYRTGAYRLELVARDEAGNNTKLLSAGRVHVRYIRIVGDIIRVPAGKRQYVYVSTDARAFRWSIGKHGGLHHQRKLLLPPLRKGRYWLVVEANGHLDRAYVVVTKRR